MNEIAYTLVGEYYLPNLILNEPPEAPPIGRYERMHKAFLKEHRPILYNQLLLSEKLYPILREIDETANARFAAVGKVSGSERNAIEQTIFADLVYL